ncbi:MAG: energy-coupling factor transporter transmembrane protein EcfT [Candidatus Bathyarchaeota archaeon]|nr:MAG: energy-coupling factor transporter transmembrane protein EcfT [Candidatus Bathyarchaeota archaeon]
MSARAKFEYEYRPTVLHHMHPLTKASLMISLAALSISWMDYRYSLVVMVLIFILSRVAKIPWVWYWLSILFTIGWIHYDLITMIFQVNPGLYKVLPQDYALKELFVVTPRGFPIVGYSALTWGTIWWMANMLVTYFAIVTSSVTLVYTLSPSDLVQLMAKVKIPSQLIYSFMAGYRFFPITTRALSDIVNAQRLRGWQASARNPVKFVRQMAPFVYPVGRQFLRSVDIVSISTATRAFGASPITPYKSFKMKAYELVLTVLSPILYVIALYLTITPPYIGAI